MGLLFYVRRRTERSFMKKILLTFCVVFCCIFTIDTAKAANVNQVEIRNTEFSEEEICNRNGKLLIECRLAWVGYGGGNAFYLDNGQSIYIGRGKYTSGDIVEIVMIWNPGSNYSDDCIYYCNAIRTLRGLKGTVIE